MFMEQSVLRMVNRWGLESKYSLEVFSKTATYIDPDYPSKGKTYATTPYDITIIYSYYVEKAFNNEEVYPTIDEVMYIYCEDILPQEKDQVKDLTTNEVYEIVKVKNYRVSDSFYFTKCYLKK